MGSCVSACNSSRIEYTSSGILFSMHFLLWIKRASTKSWGFSSFSDKISNFNIFSSIMFLPQLLNSFKLCVTSLSFFRRPNLINFEPKKIVRGLKSDSEKFLWKLKLLLSQISDKIVIKNWADYSSLFLPCFSFTKYKTSSKQWNSLSHHGELLKRKIFFCRS